MNVLSVCASVCPAAVYCGKTADRIRMPFGIISRAGPGIRQALGFGNRYTGRGTFGSEFGARHCNQWGLYGVRVLQRRDAALFPNYFGQTCYRFSLAAFQQCKNCQNRLRFDKVTESLKVETFLRHRGIKSDALKMQFVCIFFHILYYR